MRVCAWAVGGAALHLFHTSSLPGAGMSPPHTISVGKGQAACCGKRAPEHAWTAPCVCRHACMHGRVKGREAALAQVPSDHSCCHRSAATHAATHAVLPPMRRCHPCCHRSAAPHAAHSVPLLVLLPATLTLRVRPAPPLPGASACRRAPGQQSERTVHGLVRCVLQWVQAWGRGWI